MVYGPWSTVRFNNPSTSNGQCLETLKTLHVQFFHFSQKWPDRRITVKDPKRFWQGH